jgi:anti-sigma B factor antagonist
MSTEIVPFSLMVQIVRIIGRLDANTAGELKLQLKELTRNGDCNFIVDLREATFMDSTGLSILVSLMRAARPLGGDVRFAVTKPSAVYDLLQLVRFDQVFEIYETVEQAAQRFIKR